MSETTWLKCKVTVGLFGNEYTVLSSTSEGQVFSFYAPLNFLQLPKGGPAPSTEADGLIKVTLLDARDDIRLVALPVKPLDAPQVVRVRKNQLVAA